MKDRSMLPPERALRLHDDRTWRDRFWEVSEERDRLELQLFDLRNTVVGILQGELKALDVVVALNTVNHDWPKREPAPMVDSNSRSPLIYYVEMTGYVKIGYTISFKQRMSTFHVRPEQVLAIEPGKRTDETWRHKQFAEWRQPNSELFSHCPELDDHIAVLRKRYPDPWATACEMTSYKVT